MISGLQKGKFRRPSSAPEARTERSCQPTPHHTLNEERSARFTAQHLSTLFKIAQKTAFEVKGRLYTTGKVIQRLFIVDLYT